MKQMVSTTTLFKIVLVLTFLFAGFLAAAIVYNKAFRMKNESISIIEKYEGLTPKSIGIINNYLYNNGYNTKGTCEDGEYGLSSLSSTTLELSDDGKRYFYCVDFHCLNGRCRIDNNADSRPNGNKIYYDFRLFFNFDLPFLGDLLTFSITGESKGVNYYSGDQTP